MQADEAPQGNDEPASTRRALLGKIATTAMAGGLAASYGTFFVLAGRFLYPSESQKKAWMFVTEASRMKLGDALPFTTPIGQTVTITRQADKGNAADFLALSTTCPHLGCQVHWEAQNDRFFCPCHNGAFDTSGKAIAGPPLEADQSLPTYALRIEDGLLFIEVPIEQVG